MYVSYNFSSVNLFLFNNKIMIPEAKDLRIGNLLQTPKELEIKLTDYDDSGIYVVNAGMIRDCEYHKENWAFEAVPLTDEMFRILGFTQYNSAFGLDKFIVIRLVNPVQYFWNNKELKFVHTLQNLYYEIEDKELKY